MHSVIKSNGYSMKSMKLRRGVAFIVFILNLWSVSLADARVHGGQEPCGELGKLASVCAVLHHFIFHFGGY